MFSELPHTYDIDGCIIRTLFLTCSLNELRNSLLPRKIIIRLLLLEREGITWVVNQNISRFSYTIIAPVGAHVRSGLLFNIFLLWLVTVRNSSRVNRLLPNVLVKDFISASNDHQD